MHINLLGLMGFVPGADELSHFIVGSLSIVFQRSRKSGEVSVNWKLTNVPVFKKGKKETLVMTGLSVSLWGLVWRRLFWELLKVTFKQQCSH